MFSFWEEIERAVWNSVHDQCQIDASGHIRLRRRNCKRVSSCGSKVVSRWIWVIHVASSSSSTTDMEKGKGNREYDESASGDILQPSYRVLSTIEHEQDRR